MLEIDTVRLFNDNSYRKLMIEYHTFVAFILSEINNTNYNIERSHVKFHKDSILFELKDEMIVMLKQTFPQFDVSLKSFGEYYDLDEDEYSISVAWKVFKKNKN